MEKFIKIVEVGPRDGLQNEKIVLDLNSKIEFINQLSNSGLSNIEIGSFVSKDWVPQMADTANILKQMYVNPNVNYSALVPNDIGLTTALDSNINSIAVFTAATESFCQNNINCSIADSLIRIESVIRKSLSNNIPVRGYISCVLGCPYEGNVDVGKVAMIAKRLIELGCYEVSLGDTIGIGNIRQVQELISKVSNNILLEQIAVHFHDTYGQALVNVYAAIEMGVTTVDSSVAGLGGCPYAPGAAGNLATEDLLYMLHGLNITTNVDLTKVIATGHYISKKLNILPRSKVSLSYWK